MTEEVPANDMPAPEAAQDAPVVTETAAPAKRVCIMVLGMHRSGTSALTRAIGLMGAKLPNIPLGASPANETGHWEPLQLIALHDHMLAEGGSSWDDWRAFDLASLDARRLDFYRCEIMRVINDEYDGASLFVLKEPRISRFVPLYAGIMDDMGIETRYAHIKRNPLSVAASLEKRDGFSSAFCMLLWLRYELSAEGATRQKPRVFLSYEGLVNDWRTGIAHLCEGLGLSPDIPPETADALSAHFSTVHQHHLSTIGSLNADLEIPNWVKSAYWALNILEKHSRETTASEMLDIITSEFDRATLTFGNAFYDELTARNNKTPFDFLGTQRMSDGKGT